MPLEITINKQAKIVQVWLTNAEKADAALRESLRPLYSLCKAKKYLVAVMVSGGRNLGDATSDLLCSNRCRFAQLECEQTISRATAI